MTLDVGCSRFTGLFSILLALPLLSTAAPAITPARFTHSQVLLPPERAAHAMAAAELDEAVFLDADDAYANLRLFDDNDQETPFVVRPRRGETTVTQEFEIGSRREDFQLLPDNRINLVLRVTKITDQPVAVVIDTALANFEKQVSIWNSPDGANWNPLIAEQPIFDYARYLAVRNLRVALPAATDPYFRIEIANISSTQPSPLTQLEQERRGGAVVSTIERESFTRQDFRIDGIRLIGQHTFIEKSELLKRGYAITEFNVSRDGPGRTTRLSFRAGRAPLTDVEIITAAAHFCRAVTVEGSDAPDRDWATLASGTITRLRTGSFREDHAVLTWSPASRFAHYRLTIQDQDSPPLEITGVQVRGETHEVVFFPESGRTYRLLHGADAIQAPRYDVTAALAAAEAMETDPWRLDKQSDNPAFRAPVLPGWWSNRTLLSVAIVAVVAILGWILARVARNLPKP